MGLTRERWCCAWGMLRLGVKLYQRYMESVYFYISVPHILGIDTEPLVAQLYCTLAYEDNQLNW